ncbi:efflux RND transporter periplasmic adaptor subunit [Halomonas saccharevitans]|uniref:Efflux RND transporter periplasmic adaptor subunit n=1 Tax=Halomonas saccharevitans TaxID=416872 RepID=A0ABU3NC01_9GAMM|nr:efflux RND transporter periplasmic adaptor subunit [Halomonas saccharevitans]MDT8878720.1 efflux RND transporter periplasmic adaptor subunit [Halomonas saccharevitans]
MTTFIKRGRAGLVALAASLVLAACGQQETPEQQASGQGDAPPAPKQVMEMARQDLPLDKSYPSKLRSDDEVTLVARVTGFLEQRHFEPGEMVEKGESLYSIEPDLYESVVAQREADLESARAELSRAQRDANRFQQLLSQNSVSRQQVDQAQAELNVARASVSQAEAALANARIDLGYAEVTAPVAGMIGLSEVNLGNLVQPGTTLTTITPLDPLEVRFQLPQNDAFALRRQLSDQPIDAVTAWLDLPAGVEGERLEGHLDFLGSRVNEATSTVQATATFANPDAQVLPGQFVRVHLEGVKRFNVLAVPEIAMTQGLMGPQVYVLDEDNKARARTVQLGEIAGPWQILLDGVEPGERVVVGDPAGLQPGTAIEPQPFAGIEQIAGEGAGKGAGKGAGEGAGNAGQQAAAQEQKQGGEASVEPAAEAEGDAGP